MRLLLGRKGKEYKEHIEYTFSVFCKSPVVTHWDIGKKQKNESSLNYLTKNIIIHLQPTAALKNRQNQLNLLCTASES